MEYGGNLTSVQSSQENDFIFGLTKKLKTWIGGNDIANEGRWVWNDGAPWSYTNWESKEPNNRSGKEKCLEMGRYGIEWNDNACNNKYNAICKRKSTSIGNQSISTNLLPIFSCQFILVLIRPY